MRTLHYAIVFVKDMKKSIAFYQDVIGLALKFESPEWSEFVTGQATVALHLAQDVTQVVVGVDGEHLVEALGGPGPASLLDGDVEQVLGVHEAG